MDAANRVFLETYNIVDAVKSGKAIGSVALQKAGKGGMGRYYTFMTTCHDNSRTNVNGDRIMIGYQAIFAPFIPLWYMGEEWNNPKNAIPGGTGVLYYNRIDWAQKEQPKNKAFFEDLKKMIRIRRQYPDLFSYFPENHRNANICKVKVTGSEELQGYARYANGIGILIVPNANLHNPSARFRIAVPFSDMGIKGDKTYTITELMSGTEVGNGKKEQLSTITFAVPNGSLSVFLVQEKGAVTTAPTTGKTDRPAPSSGSSVSASAAEKPTVGSSAGSGSMNTGSVAGDQTGEMVEPTTAASDEQTSVQPSTGEKPGQSTAINDRPVAAGTTALSQHAKGLDGGWIALIIAAAVLAAGGVAVAVLLKTGKIRLRK